MKPEARRIIPLAAVALAACAHAKAPETAAAATATPPAAPAAAKAPEVTTATEHSTRDLNDADMSAHRDLEAALERLRDASVFFGFDEVRLTPEGEQRLSDIAVILVKHRNFRIRVEGNCDERGTTQYNLLLGQRRSDAAREYLLRMGAAQDQVATISYGKDRPKAQGHDERAWEQNRRDDVVPVAAPH